MGGPGPSTEKKPPGPDTATAGAHAGLREEDLRLARAVVAGSAEAWERFVRRYSGLILAVIRRYLHPRDEDELRTVYVNVLASLYERKLAGYQGRAALSTWLTAVTRTEVMDDLRRRFGRREIARGLRGLEEVERRIYVLYYVQGQPLAEILGRLRQEDPGWTMERLITRLRAIEQTLDDRTLRRIAYDLHAQSTGAASGRLLEYLDHVRLEFSQNEGAHSPDYHIMEREARHTVERVHEIISSRMLGIAWCST